MSQMAESVMKNMRTKRFVIITALSLVPLCLLMPVYSFAQDAGQEIRISRNIEYSTAVNHNNKTEALLLDLYELPKLNQAKRPVIILVHGGGFGSGDKGYTESQGSFYPDLAKAFALNGFVAFSVNYRLWPGCPADSFRIELENAVSDLLDAVRWIKRKSVDYGIDTAKIIIGGDSAGGGLAVNVAYCNPHLFSACIDMWGGLPPYGTKYPGRNPVNTCRIVKNTPPTCIIHGTADDVIPYNISKNLADSLTGAGIVNELHPLPGAAHYPIQLTNQVLQIAIDFSKEIVAGVTGSTLIIESLSESAGNAANNLEIIQKAILKCHQLKIRHLVFPKGVYAIGNEKTIRDMDAIMTGKISPRTVFKENYASFNIAMNFSGINDLIIDGQGCTLLFNGLIQPFEIKDCSNLIIRNLTIDWKRPLFSEGIVKMVKGEMLEVEVYPEFPVRGGEPVISFQSFSTSTGHLSGVCQFTDISSLELVAPQTARFKAYDAKFVKTGDIVIMRHMYNYRPGFNLFNCSNVKIQDVTINALPGMGVIGTRTKDITLKRYNVRPSGRRIMSGNVDATHFVSCTGTIEIDSCYFEGMGDDATNVHSYYYTIGERINDNTVRAFIAHSFAPGEKMRDYPDVGDKVEFVRKNTLFPYDNARIISVDFNSASNESVIRFDRPLPRGFDNTDLIANISKHARLKFTNNTVRDIRGRGILVQTRGALIENKRFEYCTGQGIHIDTAYPWMESVGTRDVVIRSNKFLNCGYGNTTYCDAIGIVVETECTQPYIGVHRNLTIENNLIIGQLKPAFYLSCLDGAIIKCNRVISNGSAARLEYAANIIFEDNNFGESDVVYGPGCLKISGK